MVLIAQASSDKVVKESVGVEIITRTKKDGQMGRGKVKV